MTSSPDLVVLYSRIDAFGDGLLRMPAIRAARTAFPEARIVYGSGGPSTLEKLLRRHVDHLIDDFRLRTSLPAILAEFAPNHRKVAIADFRMVVAHLIATRAKLAGKGYRYEANFPGHLLSLGQGVKLKPRPEHNAWRYHRLVERLAERRLAFDHRITVPEAARERAREILGGQDRRLVLLSANGEGNKRLTAEQTTALARHFADGGADVLYLETPGPGPETAALAAGEPRMRIIGPSLGLAPADLDDLFLALGETADLYVGSEGGMAHLLAAVATPMAIVNHGVSIERWRPLSNVVEVVEAKRQSPDGRVDGTPPEVILEAAERVLSAQARDHGERRSGAPATARPA
jgi:ADP-heptose:LPS heptosyltransferase